MFLCLIFLITSLHAQDIIDQTTDLLKSGNAKGLAKMFAPKVDLAILKPEATYTAARAEQLTADFFLDNSPVKAKVIHRITSNPKFNFAVIELTTAKGTYRVSVNLKNNGTHFELDELHIELQH